MNKFLCFLTLLLCISAQAAVGPSGVTQRITYINNGGDIVSATRAAPSGTLIYIGPGNYIGRIILTNNLRFYVSAGANITNYSTFPLISDYNFASTNIIAGSGNFYHVERSVNYGGLTLSNAATVVSIDGNTIKTIEGDINTQPLMIFKNCRLANIRFNIIDGALEGTYDDEWDAVYWYDGMVNINADNIIGDKTTVFMKGNGGVNTTNRVVINANRIQSFHEACFGSDTSGVGGSNTMIVNVRQSVSRGYPNGATAWGGGNLILTVDEAITESQSANVTGDGIFGYYGSATTGQGSSLVVRCKNAYSGQRLFWANVGSVFPRNFFDVKVDNFYPLPGSASYPTNWVYINGGVNGVISIGNLSTATNAGAFAININPTNTVRIVDSYINLPTTQTNIPIDWNGLGALEVRNTVLLGPTNGWSIRSATTNTPALRGFTATAPLFNAVNQDVVWSTLYAETTLRTNLFSDGSFTNVATNTIAANTLTNYGDTVVGEWVGNTAFQAATNDIRVLYGSQSVLDTGLQSASNGVYRAQVRITRTGNTTQLVNSRLDWMNMQGVPFTFTNQFTAGVQTNGIATSLGLQVAARRGFSVTNTQFRIYYISALDQAFPTNRFQ